VTTPRQTPAAKNEAKRIFLVQRTTRVFQKARRRRFVLYT